MILPRMHYSFLFGFIIALLGLMAFAHPAFAQAVGTAGNFSCSGGHASGTLYDSGSSCPTTMKFNTIFSFLVCNMEQLSSNVLGNMYCGMMQAMIPGVMAVLTMAVFFFGLGFTIGVIPATASEFQAFLLKIAFVFVFATQADFMIGILYKFLITGMREGITIILGSYFPADTNGDPANGATMYKYLDRFLGQTIKYATDSVGGTTPENRCKNAVFGVLAVMAVAFPPITYIALALVFRIALTFLRAVFGYIYALVGIAFLITLAPFFLSFYLFRATRHLFDKWVGYLVSFTLQMILVFTFLVFILSLDVKTITSSFADIIVPVTEAPTGTSFTMPWQYCTVCEFKAVNRTSGADIPDTNYKDFLAQGKLVCKDNPGKPIRLTSAAAPEGGNAPGANANNSNPILNSLLRFTLAGLGSLMVLAFIVEALLKMVPQLAQSLAGGLGGLYAPQLGGGTSSRGLTVLSMPGEGQIDDFEQGFTRGFHQSNNSVGGIAGGIRGGITNMLEGKVGGQSTSRPEVDAPTGIWDRLVRWGNDPNQDKN